MPKASIPKIVNDLKTPDPNSKPNDPEFLWGVEAMTAVIAAKKESRNQKGQVMNCFVLKTDHDENGDELAKFLDHLKANVADLEGQRFQLACQSGEHWFPIDIQVKNGRVQAIIMEAGFSPCTPSSLGKIKDRFPDAEVYAFLPDDVKISGKDKTRMLQADNNSCSRFTLEHIFHMQTKDMFAIFEQHKAAFTPPPILPAGTNYKTVPKDQVRMSDLDYYQVTPANMPAEAAFLFRDTQSLSIINSLNDNVKNQVVNKKGETLLESVATHTQQIDTPDGRKISVNKAVADFREGKVQETVKFLKNKTDADVDKLLAKRDGTDFLTKGKAYREQDKKEQQSLTKNYTTVLKNETEKTQSKISNYAREVKNLLEDVKAKNPNNAALVSSLESILQRVENIRIEAMNHKGNTFHDTEKLLKKTFKELSSIHQEIKGVQRQYGNEINQQDLAQIIKKFESIRDSLSDLHAAEVKNAKLSDTVGLTLDTIKSVFKSKNDNAPPKSVNSAFALHQKNAPPLVDAQKQVEVAPSKANDNNSKRPK